uniref:Uncharacterized protein n=1 Tax=Odontella aurita TaxID=265563 RepID=A0A7S4J2Q7_9STRA
MASAASCYVKERLHTSSVLNDMIFFRRDRSVGSIDESLFSPLYSLLVSEGKAVCDSDKSVQERLCSALYGLKVLIVIDGADGIENEMCRFFRCVFEKAAGVHFLLTAERQIGFMSSCVVEKAISIDPLDHSSAVKLFEAICPHTESNSGVLDFLPTCPENSFRNAETVRCGIRSSITRAICSGIPSQIVEAAQNTTRQDYDDLVALGTN